MITFKDVHKSFGNFQVLKGVDFSIPPNKITVILGRSGSGKSVILKTILGFLKPDRGQVIINGKDTSRFRKQEWLETRKSIGMLFQDSALFDSMNVFENTAFPLREHTKKSEDEIREIVLEKLRLVGLKGHHAKNPSELSGGMRKRAALARSIAMDPEIILFDEPTTGLDPIVTQVINNLIQETQQTTRATCVVISHDIGSSFDMADQIAMLYEGTILQTGAAREMKNTQNPIIRQFIRGELEGPFDIFY